MMRQFLFIVQFPKKCTTRERIESIAQRLNRRQLHQKITNFTGGAVTDQVIAPFLQPVDDNRQTVLLQRFGQQQRIELFGIGDLTDEVFERLHVAALRELVGMIDADAMRAMNLAVDRDHEGPEAVARRYLDRPR